MIKREYTNIEPPEDFTLPFHIHNQGSEFSEFFSLVGPYQFMDQICNPQEDIWSVRLLAPQLNIFSNMNYATYLKLQKLRPSHQHEYYEFAYVLDGELIQIIENKKYHFTAGQGILLNQNIRHLEGKNDRNDVLFFMVSETYLKKLLTLTSSYVCSDVIPKNYQKIHNFVYNSQKAKYYYAKEFLCFLPSGLPLVTEQFLQIIHELSIQLPGYEQIVQGILCRIFSDFCNSKLYTIEKHTLDGKNDDKLFNQISQLFEKNNGNVSRKKLAEELNYNKDYLNSIVKRHTGMSLKKYGQLFSLRMSTQLLKENELTISEIIQILGFSNRTYFYQIFMEKYGMTPKEYRKQYGDSKKEKM